MATVFRKEFMYILGILLCFFSMAYTAYTYRKREDPVGWALDTPFIIQMIVANEILHLILNLIYYLGYVIILLSSWNIVKNLLTIAALYFICMPLWGGIIKGIPDGIRARKRMKIFNKEHGIS